MIKKLPDTIVLVFYMVIVAAALTWIIPSGEYIRESHIVNGTAREVVVENSFHYVESSPQFYSVFFSLFDGFVDKADVIAFVLIVGGAFWILNSTGAIDKGIKFFVSKLRAREKGKKGRWSVDDLFFAFIMVAFSLFGAVFGMSEETLAFILIFVPMAISMGYDSIVGVCLCYLAAHVGFAGAMLNPFTIGIAQGIVGLPLFSGIEYRALCWLLLTTTAILIVIFYAHKVRRNPEFSPMHKLDSFWRNLSKDSDEVAEEKKDKDGQIGSQTDKRQVFKRYAVLVMLVIVQIVAAFKNPISSFSLGGADFSFPILPIVTALFVFLGVFTCIRSVAAFLANILLFTILYLMIGVLSYQWYMTEIAGLFFAMGLAAGLSAGYDLNELMRKFIQGVKDMLGPAIVIGLASGIILILQEGKIIDTVLYSVSSTMAEFGEVTSLAGMYVFETALNLIMPSGSAKAALTMPILAPLSDILHISRQTVVLAFQFGDGFTNMITPTSGVLLGVLGVAKIPYTVWVKWVYKYILFWILFGFVLLLPTIYLSFNGF